MNLLELESQLRMLRIRRDAYNLSGDAKSECYVLQKIDDCWQVFYSERGIESGVEEFSTEHEACEHLLDLLTNDPTTRES
jgi:hypothetical protein